LPATTTYTLACTDPLGPSISVAVTATVFPPVTNASLAPTAANLTTTESTTLTWSATGAQTCKVTNTTTSQVLVPSGGASGTVSTGALGAGTSNFLLSCTNPAGSGAATAAAQVSVYPPVTNLSLTPAAGSLTTTESTILTWGATGALNCTITNTTTNATLVASGPTSGTVSTGPLAAGPNNFALSCNNLANDTAGVGTAKAQVSVYAPVMNASLTATDTSLTTNESTILTWGATGALNCTVTNTTTSATLVSNGPASGTVSTGALAAGTNNFGLSCNNLAVDTAGLGTAQTAISVYPPVTSTSLSPTSASLTTGESTTLTWSSSGALNCTVTNTTTSAVLVSGGPTSGTVSTGALLAGTNNFALSCNNPAVDAAGVGAAHTAVAVYAPVGSVSFSATPPNVTAGTSTTLQWSSSGGSYCTVADLTANKVLVPSGTPSGTFSVSPAATTTYQLSCFNSAGDSQGSKQITITVPVYPPATISSFSVSPTVTDGDEHPTFSWKSNAASCAITGTGTNATGLAASGSLTLAGYVKQTTVYTLTCKNGAGTAATAKTTLTFQQYDR
jgi:hypothetical protein